MAWRTIGKKVSSFFFPLPFRLEIHEFRVFFLKIKINYLKNWFFRVLMRKYHNFCSLQIEEEEEEEERVYARRYRVHLFLSMQPD